MTKSKICPVCKNKSTMLDVVDFNKNCLESAGVFLPLEGVPIYYYQCENCLFTFAPEFQTWSDEKFLKKIYNDEYIKVDSDYLENRPRQNSKLLIKTFEGQKNFINHIDYGGGNGLRGCPIFCVNGG